MCVIPQAPERARLANGCTFTTYSGVALPPAPHPNPSPAGRGALVLATMGELAGSLADTKARKYLAQQIIAAHAAGDFAEGFVGGAEFFG